MEISEVSRLIKKTRKASGLSQQELAQLAGIGKTAIFDIERGKETIQFRTLMKVLNALNIKLTVHSPLGDYDE